MKFYAIITAGGTSSRFGKENKLLQKVNDKTVLEHSVNAFLNNDITKIIITANEKIIDEIRELFITNENVTVVLGGASRQESVHNGLKAANGCDYVLIHDGARPMVSKKLVADIISLLPEKKSIVTMTKTVDTIKEVADGKIIRTIPRDKLYNTQTPQAFEYNLILDAHQKLVSENFTDDAGMLEHLGKDVFIIDGDYKNIKITTASDMEMAKVYLKEE